MVSIVKKNIKGHKYLYLVESHRDGTRVIQKTLKYIGKERPIRKEELACMQLSAARKDWVLKKFEEELSYQDHAAMKQASTAYHQHQNSLDKMSREKEREQFLSKFIANSNAIEGSTLTPDETFNFLFNDVSPKNRNKKELFMATNMLEAWEYVEQHHLKLPTKKDLWMLYQLVNKGIEEEQTLGKYKERQNYIGNVLTTSTLYVEERMQELFAWIRRAKKEANEFEIAFQSHAQFEIIHPFIDGNGRVGRLLLNWILLKEKLAPLAINVKRRGDYIDALENARRGKLKPICTFCMREYLDQHSYVKA